jgi:hypothetical protein
LAFVPDRGLPLKIRPFPKKVLGGPSPGPLRARQRIAQVAAPIRSRSFVSGPEAREEVGVQPVFEQVLPASEVKKAKGSSFTRRYFSQEQPSEKASDLELAQARRGELVFRGKIC